MLPIRAFCSGAHSLSRHKRDRSLHPLWYLLYDGESGEFLLARLKVQIFKITKITSGIRLPLETFYLQFGHDCGKKDKNKVLVFRLSVKARKHEP
jgi:hypothetical protein